jgi:hypothetical protein
VTIPVLPERFDVRVTRLALGIELVDAPRARRVANPVTVLVEPAPLVDPLTAEQRRLLARLAEAGTPLHDAWRRVPRHASCRHALVFEPGRGTHVDLRVLDASERFVPRRLRVPLVDLGAPEDLAALDALPTAQRARFPSLFPGAAYDVSYAATGLRGRVVVSDGLAPPTLVPVRWPRVEARTSLGADPIAWAHGDARGEFLLLLPPEAIPAPAVELPAALELLVTAHGRRGLPAAPPPIEVRAADPFWDVPLEPLGAPGVTPDPVADGQVIPADYDGAATQTVAFTYGAIVSAGIQPFDIT